MTVNRTPFDNQDDSDLDDDKPLGYDDPNCCPECGDSLDFSDVDEGFCWSCDI
jgi:hypothetical protein